MTRVHPVIIERRGAVLAVHPADVTPEELRRALECGDSDVLYHVARYWQDHARNPFGGPVTTSPEVEIRLLRREVEKYRQEVLRCHALIYAARPARKEVLP